MKRRWIILVACVIALGAVLVVYSRSMQTDRLVRRTVQAMNAGDLEEADRALSELAAVTSDSMDLTAIESLRMAIAIAQLVRDAQLTAEYERVSQFLGDEEEAVGVYEGTIHRLQQSLRRSQDEMMARARAYHGRHFQYGLRLSSPLSGVLQLPTDDDREIAAAFNDLLTGQANDAVHDVIYESIAREAIGGVLRLVIAQPPDAPAHTVHLQGRLDLAELWWLIAVHSNNPLFSETALDIVLEETEEGHPARARALEALRYFGRIS